MPKAETMPIPPLNVQGLLPVGVHDCTLEEIQSIFGTFQGSDRRVRLTQKLAEYLTLVCDAKIGLYLYVDGSYVTAEEKPGDIDVLLILQEDINLDGDIPPFEYNARSGKFIKRNFGIDFYFGFENDPSADKLLSLFRRVKSRPDEGKGVLRIML